MDFLADILADLLGATLVLVTDSGHARGRRSLEPCGVLQRTFPQFVFMLSKWLDYREFLRVPCVTLCATQCLSVLYSGSIRANCSPQTPIDIELRSLDRLFRRRTSHVRFQVFNGAVPG